MMKRFAFCIFLLILWLPSLVFGLEVRFKESAVARSRMLTLEDVAEIHPSSGEKLGAVVLFAAPAPGEQACYPSSTLKAYVREAVSVGTEIEWSGAETVCVRHAGHLVKPEEIVAVINARLQEKLAHLGAKNVQFSLRNRPEPVPVPRGRVTYRVIFSDPNVLESRQATVLIRVDGQVEENISVPGRVMAFLPVAAAAAELKRGHVLRRSDVVSRPENIAGLRRPCLDVNAIVGMRLKRSVAGGEVLSRSDVESPVLVERRQVVTMVLEQGALRIRARGMATADGKKGEVIRVQNIRSRRDVFCKVIGDGVVEVVF